MNPWTMMKSAKTDESMAGKSFAEIQKAQGAKMKEFQTEMAKLSAGD